MTIDIMNEIDIELLTKIAKELGLPNRVELAQYVYENPDKKFKTVDEFVKCFRQYLILKELQTLQEEVRNLKMDLKKRKQFVVEFEDGSQETVFADDVEIVQDKDVIARVLKK